MKFIDFFAGMGGFRLGMEMAGHECVGHCEIDKFANKSYMAMHRPKESEWYADDIRRVMPGDLPEAKVYCFGFPCQAFSIAGKRRGFEDTRGTLFFEVMRLVKERKPDILFAENVKGLLSHDRGRTFGTIIRTMDELGYDVEWQLLNSANFEVPQNRERVFIIGHLRGRCTRKVFPLERAATENTIKQIVGGGQGERVYDPCGIGVTLSSQGGGLGAKTGLYFIDMNPAGKITETTRCLQARYNKGVTSNEGECSGVTIPVSTPDRVKKRQNGRRFKEDGEPMFTLTSQDRHGVMLGRRIRKLTPKECFRLQGFPDEYFERAAAVNSDSQLYKQAGNSATVNVIYEMARRL